MKKQLPKLPVELLDGTGQCMVSGGYPWCSRVLPAFGMSKNCVPGPQQLFLENRQPVEKQNRPAVLVEW